MSSDPPKDVVLRLGQLDRSLLRPANRPITGNAIVKDRAREKLLRKRYRSVNMIKQG